MPDKMPDKTKASMHSKNLYGKSLFWFRRDLRLKDNTALYHAIKESQQLAFVFVFDSNILNKLADKDDKRVFYIFESLMELKSKLKALGSDLLVVYGDPQELIPSVAEALGVDVVFTNRDYEAYPLKRDEMVQAKLNQDNRQLITCKDHVIFESTEVTKADKKPYTIFTPYKRAWLTRLIEDPKAALYDYPSEELLKKSDLVSTKEIENANVKLFNAGAKLVAKISDIGFKETEIIVKPGTDEAHKQLESFFQQKVFTYKTARDFPSEVGTSHMSVHLRFGTVSIRECYRKAQELLDKAKSAEEKENIEGWLSELIWREFYSMILQAFPHVEEKSFRKEYQNLLWRVDKDLLTAWKEGKTGYPIVDAGMRQLKQTGQMHNRVRMITASFLVKDLLINWKEGEAHFAQYLLDFDLASNNGGWQWAASTGTDAAPYFRIFNPSLQGQRFDPKCLYIKKFVPELKDVDPEKIHKLNFVAANYPKPIVKHEEVKAAVLEMFKKAKQ
ncbi:MAG: deoxyribodipyrimidine photo-lyase [Candidatus Caenarcaniphilales bacterium]|nr:deoxyribodipyrimidine photo-lyase [Candidatus Caenarcaniphilales bacterium]